MQIGCLGDIVFKVSDNEVKTINGFSWSGSAKIHSHDRHLGNPVQEFVGINPDKISFTLKLSAYLGVNPMTDINKIFEYERSGTAVPLILGKKIYGKDLWLIESHSVSGKYYDNEGDITDADVKISLIEYVRE